jgi:MFS family permease
VLLEAATLVSATGNGVAMVALPWLALELTGSAASAGLVAAGAALPLVVSSLFSGTLVDRFGRRRTAMVADLFSLMSVAAIPIVEAAGGLSIGVLVALAALGAVFDPAGVTGRETLLPAAAAEAGWQLERANGLHEAMWNSSFLVGPGVGGLLIATVGAADTLWMTAGAFAVSFVLTAGVRVVGAEADEHEDRPEGIWSGTSEGLRFVFGDPVLRTSALLTMFIVALYLPVEGVILPTYFTEQDQPARLGSVLMALSVGGLVGSLAYGRWGVRFSRRGLYVTAMVAVGVPIFAMALLPPFPVMVALAGLTGLIYGPIPPLTNYAMQTRTPESLRGRVVGVLTSVEFAAGPLGYLLVGPLVEAVGLRSAFVGLSVALVAVTFTAVPAKGLRLLDEPPRFAPAAVEPPASHGPVPLGEQSIPPAA